MQPDSPAYRLSLRLDLDVLVGSSIEDTIAHALDVAQKLGLVVTFTFHGIRLNVSPDKTAGDIFRAYHEAARVARPAQIDPDDALARVKALAAARLAAAEEMRARAAGHMMQRADEMRAAGNVTGSTMAAVFEEEGRAILRLPIGGEA